MHQPPDPLPCRLTQAVDKQQAEWVGILVVFEGFWNGKSFVWLERGNGNEKVFNHIIGFGGYWSDCFAGWLHTSGNCQKPG